MKYFKLLLLLSFIFSIAACNHKRSQTMIMRLQKWDDMLENNPESVRDSLYQINLIGLSKLNKAYYGLLKTIADDKNFISFNNDSLISEAEKQLKHAQKGSNLHIRSLIYQGIVRYRMGLADSTVFVPLKEAERLFSLKEYQDPKTGFILNNYLGEVTTEAMQNNSASIYYHRALSFAKSINDQSSLFDAYNAVFWNELIGENFEIAKQYLDILEQFENLTPDELYRHYNSQSIYFETQSQFREALEAKKKQVELLPHLKENKDLSRIYTSISKRYGNLNYTDSAFYYAQLAIEAITDTTYAYNYLLYENAADASEKVNNYQTAVHYQKNALKLLEKSINRKVELQVVSIENKYA